MQKWEYKRVYDPSESSLNEMGDEGWELVSVVASTSGDSYSTSSSVYAYLKRSVESDDYDDSDDDDEDEDDDERVLTW